MSDYIENDQDNWKSLKQFGAGLESDLNSSTGTTPSDGTWRVVNSGPLTWDCYNPAIQMLGDGEGAPLQIEVQDNKEDEMNTPDFWLLGHNRVKQMTSTSILMKLDSFPKDWPIEALVAEVSNWLRKAKQDVQKVQQDTQAPNTTISPPPGGGGMGGMGAGGAMPFASRKARLTSIILNSR